MIREEGVEQLYAHYRPLFIGYIRKRYQLEEEVASDIYHDSFLLMMDNIRTGKYQQQDFTADLSFGNRQASCAEAIPEGR